MSCSTGEQANPGRGSRFARAILATSTPEQCSRWAACSPRWRSRWPAPPPVRRCRPEHGYRLRLTAGVSSRRSHEGDPVSAVLIAPVPIGSRSEIPAGWTLRGVVREAGHAGGRACLRLEFDPRSWTRTAGLRRSPRASSPSTTRARWTATGASWESGRSAACLRPWPLSSWCSPTTIPSPSPRSRPGGSCCEARSTPQSTTPQTPASWASSERLRSRSPQLRCPPDGARGLFPCRTCARCPVRTQASREHRDGDVTDRLFVGSKDRRSRRPSSSGLDARPAHELSGSPPGPDGAHPEAWLPVEPCHGSTSKGPADLVLREATTLLSSATTSASRARRSRRSGGAGGAATPTSASPSSAACMPRPSDRPAHASGRSRERPAANEVAATTS